MAEAKGKKNVFQIIFKLLSYIVIAFVCVITFFLLYYIVTSQLHAKDENYRPGISIYTIVSPSMTPTIKVYDVVINAKAKNPTDIQIGDIITYKSKAANSEGMTITHRVVAVDKTQDGQYEYMTQGDNNKEPDGLMVTFDQVIGKEIMIIPKVGRLQFIIANQKGWLLLLLIPIGIYLLKEFFKLIDLFGLRKKVVKVIEQPSEPIVVKPTKVEVEERKERIKENLNNKTITKEAVIKSDKEPESFLEAYTETKLEVKTNKYANLKQKNQEKQKEIRSVAVEEDKPVAPIKIETKVVKEVKPVEKEIVVLPKKKEEVNQEYEILDTDELTTKIKEYDDKLKELNKMISDIDNIKPKKEEPKEEPFAEVDNFLKGGRIKVKKVEETKNQKKKITSKRVTDPSKYVEDVKIELSPIVQTSSYNPRAKIARPESVDINDLRKAEIKNKPAEIKPIVEKAPVEKKQPKKKRLYLNPREVTKVKKNKPAQNNNNNSNNNKPKTTRKNLALNPKAPQKATRNRRNIPNIPNNRPMYAPVQQPRPMPMNKQIKQPTPRKREKFIIIEKIK